MSITCSYGCSFCIAWHTIHRMAYCLVAVSLVACGGGSGTSTAPGDLPTGNVQAPNVPLSLKAQIAQLESSGALPTLDRSTSLIGPDINNNGIRDDIEAYITRLPLTSGQQQAALQKAKTLQMTLTVTLTDKVALQKVGDALMASTNCLGDNFPEGRSEMSSRIEAMTANTRERAKRYMEYNAARSGSSTVMPSGNTCE